METETRLVKLDRRIQRQKLICAVNNGFLEHYLAQRERELEKLGKGPLLPAKEESGTTTR